MIITDNQASQNVNNKNEKKREKKFIININLWSPEQLLGTKD